MRWWASRRAPVGHRLVDNAWAAGDEVGAHDQSPSATCGAHVSRSGVGRHRGRAGPPPARSGAVTFGGGWSGRVRSFGHRIGSVCPVRAATYGVGDQSRVGRAVQAFKSRDPVPLRHLAACPVLTLVHTRYVSGLAPSLKVNAKCLPRSGLERAGCGHNMSPLPYSAAPEGRRRPLCLAHRSRAAQPERAQRGNP